MEKATTSVGLDIDKKEIVVEMLVPGQADLVEWKLRYEPAVIRRLAKRLIHAGEGEVECVCEAGPCG